VERGIRYLKDVQKILKRRLGNGSGILITQVQFQAARTPQYHAGPRQARVLVY